MRFVFLFLLLTLTFRTYGASKNCEAKPSFEIKLQSGVNSTSEAKVKIGAVKLGGASEQMPTGGGRAAVQKALLSCTPGILECFKAKPQKTAELMISFVLVPSGKNLVAKDWIFTSKDKAIFDITPCLTKVLSEAKFDLQIKKDFQVMTPLQVTVSK